MTTPARYLDLQVNGYGGVDFNQDDLSPDGLHLACQAMRRDGVDTALATIITDHIEPMANRLRRLVDLREKDDLARSVIAGFHIEGPFLSPVDGYRGAHPLDAITQASQPALDQLLDAAAGLTRIVTLAPEQDPGLAATRQLARQGITVSAGHCNPSADQLDAAIDAGLCMFTHLGNACPMQLHRHDNIIQRVLARADKLWLCFIADGVHIPFFALQNYLHTAGMDRCIIVSDAMAAAGLGPGDHTIGPWQVHVGEDLAAWAPDKSHLLGSAMSMQQAAVNLKTHLHLSDAQIDRLTNQNPRAAISPA